QRSGNGRAHFTVDVALPARTAYRILGRWYPCIRPSSGYSILIGNRFSASVPLDNLSATSVYISIAQIVRLDEKERNLQSRSCFCCNWRVQHDTYVTISARYSTPAIPVTERNRKTH
ncbi:hypothetical protein PFISCL1PPCAC_17632, partial [Pristionchus fissidentatus]